MMTSMNQYAHWPIPRFDCHSMVQWVQFSFRLVARMQAKFTTIALGRIGSNICTMGDCGCDEGCIKKMKERRRTRRLLFPFQEFTEPVVVESKRADGPCPLEDDGGVDNVVLEVLQSRLPLLSSACFDSSLDTTSCGSQVLISMLSSFSSGLTLTLSTMRATR
jgi:hypothetical protein